MPTIGGTIRGFMDIVRGGPTRLVSIARIGALVGAGVVSMLVGMVVGTIRGTARIGVGAAIGAIIIITPLRVGITRMDVRRTGIIARTRAAEAPDTRGADVVAALTPRCGVPGHPAGLPPLLH